MLLRELKAYINSIPENLDEFLVVNGEFGLAKDNNTYVLTSNTVLTVYVDQNMKEIQLLHQTDKDVKNILMDIDDGDTE